MTLILLALALPLYAKIARSRYRLLSLALTSLYGEAVAKDGLLRRRVIWRAALWPVPSVLFHWGERSWRKTRTNLTDENAEFPV